MILATPVMVVVKVPLELIGVAYLGISIFILTGWMLNIAILRFMPEKISRRWPRVAISTITVSVVSALVFLIVRPTLPVSETQIHIVRTVNVLAVNVIIFVVSELLLTRHSKARLDTENAELKLVNLEAQFKLLKEQVNPHFLFNALGTARSLIRRDPKVAEEYIIRLSDFLRISMNQSRDLVTLEEELKLCADYISLQKIRFTNALVFEQNLAAGAAQKTVPYFSLLTLVENAIKHNSMTQEEPLRILIDAGSNKVSVTNNLQSKVNVGPLSRTGLKNLGERLRLLTGGELKVEETPTSFTVTLPLSAA